MDFATAFFMANAIIGVSLVIWIHTKPGKKWLKNL